MTPHSVTMPHWFSSNFSNSSFDSDHNLSQFHKRYFIWYFPTAAKFQSIRWNWMSLRFLAWTNLVTICSAELESEFTSNFNCDGKPISKTDPSSLKWKSYRCLTPWFILRSSSLIRSWERASCDFFSPVCGLHTMISLQMKINLGKIPETCLWSSKVQ